MARTRHDDRDPEQARGSAYAALRVYLDEEKRLFAQVFDGGRADLRPQWEQTWGFATSALTRFLVLGGRVEELQIPTRRVDGASRTPISLGKIPAAGVA